jgi:hypothetical protein
MVTTNDTSGIADITQHHRSRRFFPFSRPSPPLQTISKRRFDPGPGLRSGGNNHLAKGKLLAVDNQIDTATGPIPLKGIFRTDTIGFSPISLSTSARSWTRFKPPP